MAEFFCDDTGVEKCLKKLEAQVSAAGGWLHKDLVIREQSGELSLETSLASEIRDILIFIPENILLPLDQVEVVLSGNDLSIANPAPELTPKQLAAFEIIFEIFNLTGKIKSHKKYYPWVALADDPNTLKRLIAGRPDMNFIPTFLDDIQSRNSNSLILKSFFKTRILRLAEDQNLLVPFIDFANHHFNASSFKYASKSLNVRNIGFLNSRVIPESRETFIRYGTFDAYDLFMNFGFADPSAAFVRSIPMTLALDGLGEIVTQAFMGVEFKGKLPEDMADFRFHMPNVMAKKDNALHVTHLIIPGSHAPHALRKVLAALIKALAPNLTDADVFKFVNIAEKQVLEKNTGFYQDLKAYLNGRLADTKAEPVIKNAIAMTDLQLSILGEYKPL